MRTAYLDLIGGASGDMLLGALLSAGLELGALEKELRRLPAAGYALRAEQVARGALPCTLLHVDLDAEGARRRTWEDFAAAIRDSTLGDDVKRRASAVFDAIEAAEARAHRADRGHAKPHELGTVDTLVDIVGFVAGLKLLGIERLHASPFPAGAGLVSVAHGRVPGVAPATAEIYAAARAPLRTPGPGGPRGETVTPTGAALVATLASFDPVEMRVERVGYGAGERDPDDYPNAVGVWVGTSGPRRAARGGLTLLETNIDDMSGELFGYVQERLFEIGARDVWTTAIQMKKNRPGVLLSALVPANIAGAAADLILRETSTLGVRARAVRRYEAERSVETVETSLGPVPVKVKRLDGIAISASPEYEACRAIARASGLALAEVMRRAAAEAERALAARRVGEGRASRRPSVSP